MSPVTVESPNNHESEVGESVPPLTHHAVSVSLPTWEDCEAYEKGDQRVVSRMKTGYPRFFIHKSIQTLGDAILAKHGSNNQSIMLFPSRKVADLFVDFVWHHSDDNPRNHQIIILELIASNLVEETKLVSPTVFGCIFPKDHFHVAKQFWQHSGAGISSRRAEYCHALFKAGYLVPKSSLNGSKTLCKGPRRYQKKGSSEDSERTQVEIEGKDQGGFIEERFGRNLNISLSSEAKSAIRKRIAGTLTVNVDLNGAIENSKNTNRWRPQAVHDFSETDVYLHPSGMHAIFNTHQCLLKAIGSRLSVCYGFPYIDTLKILEKFGPGCTFYGHGSQEELDDLELRLQQGEKFLGLFCEFPGNPLLKSPDLERIRSLADQYDFAVVIDDTIGNFLNVHVLPFADVVVSSLTKIFSGDSNVMGGSAVLNPASRYYSALKQTWSSAYEDIYWAEDAIFMERNSRDFVSRAERVNCNAEAIANVLQSHSRVNEVYYPKFSPTRKYYERCRTETGGYGGLLSATFHQPDDAIKFYNSLQTFKGPSLGTNFTLSSPYVILAHWTELPWAASYGVEANLVRFSVGLEETSELISTFQRALAAIDSS